MKSIIYSSKKGVIVTFRDLSIGSKFRLKTMSWVLRQKISFNKYVLLPTSNTEFEVNGSSDVQTLDDEVMEVE